MSMLADLRPGTWNLDAAHSELGFSGRHLMVSEVRGQFKDFAAVVTIGRPFEQSTVEATVQTASIDTSSADRDAHLLSADFFDAENHPTMTFTSTRVTDDCLEGDLTIKGITRAVSFDLDFGGLRVDPWGGTRAGFEATTEISRRDFDLTSDVAPEGGGVLVGEKVRIALDLELIQA